MVVAMLSAAPAVAYEGGWYYDNNAGGREILYLGDNSDDTYRGFSGTAASCGPKGAPYARIRSIIGREYHQINWWISHQCDGTYARVCVQNSYGERACSTCIDLGW